MNTRLNLLRNRRRASDPKALARAKKNKELWERYRHANDKVCSKCGQSWEGKIWYMHGWDFATTEIISFSRTCDCGNEIFRPATEKEKWR